MEKRVVAFLISAIFLYLAGVMTGAYLGSRTTLDITFPIKAKTVELEKRLGDLEQQLDSTIGTLYVLQFLSDRNLACSIVKESLEPILSEISGMISYLPPRLETANISKDLENKYTRLNTRAYLAADYIYRNCGGKHLPILYIYEHGDVNTGYIVDTLKKEYNLLAFVAWRGSNDPLIQALHSTGPSIYVCGRLVEVNKVREVLDSCYR